jgi:hypothetical protein
MPRLETDIAKVQESCAIIIYDIIYDGTSITIRPRKVYLVPKGSNISTVTFLNVGLGDGGRGRM